MTEAGEIRSILIVLHGAIGDVTRALSVACRLKKNLPTVKIHWAVEPKSQGILENHPAVDRVVLFNRARGLLGYWEFIQKLREEKYDVVLDLQRHFKSGVTSFLSGAPRRIGFHRKNAKEFNWLFSTEQISPVENFSSKIDHYHLFASVLGVSDDGARDFGLHPDAALLGRCEELIQAECARIGIAAVSREKRVAFILGSSWPSRFWPAEYYRELCASLYERFGIVSFAVGGPSEQEFSKELMRVSSEHALINLVGKTSLQELTGIFSCMRFAIGSDSGPMHIAAGVGLPVISLWGSTSPLRSAPWGSRQLAVESNIGCSPCYRKQCPGLGNQCMKELVPSAIIEKARQILDFNHFNE